MEKKKNPEVKSDFISLKEAAKYCDYTQQYLSLRARQGKLKAVKFARNWLTKKEWIEEYVREMEEYERNQRKRIEVEPKLEKEPRFVERISISLSRISFPSKLKPALSLALIFLLLFSSIALSKESLKTIFQDTVFFIQETPKTINHVLKESKKSLASSLDSLNQSFINVAEVIQTTDYEDLKEPIPLFKEYFQWLGTNLKYQVLTFREGGKRFIKQIKEGTLAFGQATKDLIMRSITRFLAEGKVLTLYIYNLALRTSDLLVRGVTEGVPTLAKKIVDFGSRTSDKLKKGWQFLVLEFQAERKELKEFITRLFKPRIVEKPPKEPEKPVLVEVTREEFEKLKQEIERIKEEGLPVKEIIKEIEVSRITKVEPIKEITKEIKILDDESLKIIRASLLEQETDVEKLKLAASAGYVNVIFPTTLPLEGDTTIITLGTISTGTWNGNVITTPSVTSPIYTGTGAVTLSSGGAEALTLDSASGTVQIATGDSLTVPGTITGEGQLIATKAPSEAHSGTWSVDSATWQADDATIYINPSTATGDSNLLGLAVNGSVKFAIDAEGDIFGRNLILEGSTSTAATTIAGDLKVEGNTTLGDVSTDTLTFNASTIAIANNLNIDSDTLFIDASGNMVGIGTTNPGALLDVGLAGTTLGVIRLEGSTSGYAALQPTAAAGNVTITFPATIGTVALGTGTADYAAYWSGTNTLAAEAYLDVSRGGTGRGSHTAYGLITGSTTGTGAEQSLTTGSSGQILRSGGASALPAWSTATYPSTATTTGQILRADGTNWVASTSTFADTYTAYNILYASSANTVAGLATANSGVLVTSSTGVPSILGSMTNGQLVIGSTGATPVLATLTGTANEIDITNAAGSITIGIIDPLTVSKGGTGATTFGGTNTILYTTTADNLSSITTANSSILVTDGSGVPSLSTTLPAFTAGGNITGSGGITIYGGSADNEDLTLEGTSHTTKTTSYVILQPTSGNVGIGDTGPDSLLNLQASGAADNGIIVEQINAGDYDPFVKFQLADGTTNFSLGVDDSVTGDPFKISTTDLGTGDLLTLDSRTTTSGVSAFTLAGIAPTIGSAAGAEYTTLTVTPPTINLTGTTQVTSQMDSLLINAPTLAGDTATLTIDDAATFTIAGAPVESTNVDLTDTFALKINAGAVGSVTNSYGLYVDAQTGATNNYGAVFASGNVGIGTTTPSEKLEVNGNIKNSQLILRTNTIEEWVTDGNGVVAVNYYGYNGGTTQFRDFDVYDGKTNHILRVDGSSGNVGIGTTDPNVTGYTGTVLTVGAGETGLVSAIEIYGQRSGSDGTIGADLTFLNISATGSDKRVGIIRGLRLGDDNSGGLRFYSRNAGSFVNAVNIRSDGNVGIGTANPQRALHIDGGNPVNDFILQSTASNPDANTLLESLGVHHLSLAVSDVYFYAYYTDDSNVARVLAWTGAALDLAEYFKVGPKNLDANGVSMLLKGDILCADPDNKEKVIACQSSYDKNIIGIVSTQPYTTMGMNDLDDDHRDAAEVSLVGRVATLVSTQNGPIAIGDLITSSDIPGVGMKATESGRVIGMALEPLEQCNSETIEQCKIMVFVNPHWYGGSLAVSDGSLASTDLIDGDPISNNFIEKVKQVLANLGLFIENGIVKIKELVVEKLKIGSQEEPSGITLYDEETGEPYCVKMKGGELISLPGECTTAPGGNDQLPISNYSNQAPNPQPTADQPEAGNDQVGNAETGETGETGVEPLQDEPEEEPLEEANVEEVAPPQEERPPVAEEPSELKPEPEPEPEPQPEPQPTVPTSGWSAEGGDQPEAGEPEPEPSSEPTATIEPEPTP